MAHRTISPRLMARSKYPQTTWQIWRALFPLLLFVALVTLYRHRATIRQRISGGSSYQPTGSAYLAAQQRLANRKQAQWAISLDSTQEARAGAWKPRGRDPGWVSPSPYRLDPDVLANISKPDGKPDFCRAHAIWPGRPPTIILRPYSLDAAIGHSLDITARTHLIDTPFAVSPDSAPLPPVKGAKKPSDEDDEEEEEKPNGGEISQIGFLPWAPVGTFSRDDHSDEPVPRFRDGGAPSYVNFHSQASSPKNRIPPPPPSMSPGSSDSPEDVRGTAHVPDPKGTKYRTAPCLSYDVPASEEIIPKEAPPQFMFGMATTPARIMRSLPVWEDWHASAPNSTLPSWPKSPSPPRFFVLTPPRTASGDETDAVEFDRAIEALENSTIPMTVRSLTAPRNEQRYFSLVREMWKDEVDRAEKFEKNRVAGKPGEPAEEDLDQVDWFVFADDDTYFLSLGELGRMVAKHDPEVPRIVGSRSENPIQVVERIAFGGAGILLSRGMMRLLNKPNFFDSCFTKFGHLGGDGIVSFCAASAMRKPVKKVLTIEPTLHQFDIGGEAQGFFQAGLRIASLHHWNSWYSLFPPPHTTAIHDDYQAVRLLGRAARGIGPSNWGRRYVWGLSEGASGEESVVVLSLGYSLTIWAPGEMDAASLNQIEHTFGGSINLASRPVIREGHLKRTYYIIDCQPLPGTPEVFLMRHANDDGELVDLVWDGRKNGQPIPEAATDLERKADRVMAAGRDVGGDEEMPKEADGFRQARYRRR